MSAARIEVPELKVVIVAFDLNPELGSECGKAHRWVKCITERYEADVFVPNWHRPGIERFKTAYKRARFHFVHVPEAARRALHGVGASNALNAVFIADVKRRLKQLDLSEYRLLHVLTPAGVHSFNDLYEFGIPMLLGPLGGALPTPHGFGDVFSDQWLTTAARESYYRLLVHLPAWRRYFLNAEAIVCGTDYVIDVLPRGCRERVRVVFDTCVDTEFFTPADEPARTSARTLYVGSLTAKKGAILLIEALRLCRARDVHGIEVTLAGDGPLRQRLTDLVAAYGLEDSVTLLGQLPTNELLEHYRKSDIFCLPTLREPGGGAILEAMACGLPVITSDYGGPRYSVTEDCGIRIRMSNTHTYTSDLSLALERLAGDPSLRQSMGRGARKRAVEEFSMDALGERIRGIYQEFTT